MLSTSGNVASAFTGASQGCPASADSRSFPESPGWAFDHFAASKIWSGRVDA
jgi:hypothetical protein